MKKLFLIRHCQATGQAADAPLTDQGHEKARLLAQYLKELPIDILMTSPFKRAVMTIKPLAETLGLSIHEDARLREKVLSSETMDNWYDRLRESYDDFDICYEGGESNNQALQRGLAVINEWLESDSNVSVLTTHGGLLSIILHHFTGDHGFEIWKQLSNPDIFQLTFDRDGNLSDLRRLPMERDTVEMETQQ